MLFAIETSAQKHQVSYGNDNVSYTQGPYSLFFEQNGISIYSASVTLNGNTTAVCLKVVNNNSYSVLVTWESFKWFVNGTFLDPLSNPTSGADVFAYSDKFAPYETKDGIYHKVGSNASEVYKFRPNYLYFKAPKGNWGPGSISIQLSNVEVLTKY